MKFYICNVGGGRDVTVLKWILNKNSEVCVCAFRKKKEKKKDFFQVAGKMVEVHTKSQNYWRVTLSNIFYRDADNE